MSGYLFTPMTRFYAESLAYMKNAGKKAAQPSSIRCAEILPLPVRGALMRAAVTECTDESKAEDGKMTYIIPAASL